MGVLATIRSRMGAALTAISGGGAWRPIVREPYTGAWQNNDPIAAESALGNPSVFGCVSRISQDIAKIAPPQLITESETTPGIWTPTQNPAYSPVLRRPNRYQTAQQFYEQWILSKLLTGNTYILKDRDDRGVVSALYILDPGRVKPMIAPDGSVYYELQAYDLAGIPQTETPVIVPARELIHDRWNCLFHPLCGVSPLYAIAGAVVQAQAIQDSSTSYFAKGGRPSGMLVAPTKLDPASAERIKATLAGFKTGEIILTDQGMKYEDIGGSAVDAQLVEQLNWTEETVAKVFGMPISILNSSKQPPYANAEASQLQYKSQCLEPHLVSIQTCLDAGLDLPTHLGTLFDLELLIWMDTITRTNAAKTAISAGAMSPNEARSQYFGLGPVPGGETPYLQQQNWPLSSLADRPPPTVPGSPPPAGQPDPAAELVLP